MNLQDKLNQRNALLKQVQEATKVKIEERSQEDKNKIEKLFADIETLDSQIQEEQRKAKIEGFSYFNEVDQDKEDLPEEREVKKTAELRDYLKGIKAKDKCRALDLDDSGGIVTPVQASGIIWQEVNDAFPLLEKCDVIRLVKPTEVSFGALTDPADADWSETAGEDSTMDISEKKIKPTDLAKLIKLNYNLIMQSEIPIEQFVARRFAHKFGVTVEKALMTGNGSSDRPVGIFHADSNNISTGRDIDTGTTTTAFTYQTLLAMKFAIKANYNPQWFLHRDAMYRIFNLEDTDGQLIFRPAEVPGQKDILLGLPVNTSEFVPNTFTAGNYVGALGDPRAYQIATARDFTVQVLKETYATTNQIGYVFRSKLSGRPSDENAWARIKLADETTTQ